MTVRLSFFVLCIIFSFLEYITILNVRTEEQVLYCHDCSILFLLVITVNEYWTRD